MDNVPKARFVNLVTEKPKFVDEKTFLREAFGSFLIELDDNFIPKIPDAKESLINLVAFMVDGLHEIIGDFDKICKRNDKREQLQKQGLYPKDFELN